MHIQDYLESPPHSVDADQEDLSLRDPRFARKAMRAFHGRLVRDRAKLGIRGVRLMDVKDVRVRRT